MLMTILLGSIFAAVLAGLTVAAVAIRRRQRALKTLREASQLQRRADHLFRIALAAHVHTRDAAIAKTLLEDAIQVLEHSLRLDAHATESANSLRECRELLAGIDAEPAADASAGAGASRDPMLDFPETELMEAQLHLIEATRLLIGLEKRGRISYDSLSAMTATLKQAQRAIDLRLQLRRATHALNEDHHSPKLDEAGLASEYLAASERNRA